MIERETTPEERSERRHAILVVEDETLIRILVADELRARGFLVIEATNADEALAVLKTGTEIDLLITDIHMPGSMDGYALAQHVRQSFPLTKVMVASSDDSRARLADAHAIASKPFDFPLLFVAIKNLLTPGT